MNYPHLLKAIAAANRQLVGRAATAVNQALVVRNWMIGAHLVEFEQAGADRAKYGVRLLDRLAKDLKTRGLKGLDERTLRDCRAFFGLYPQIRGSVNPEFVLPGDLAPSIETTGTATASPPSPTPRPEPQKTGAARAELAIRGSLTPELPTPLSTVALLRLPWTHFQLLLRLDDPWKRAFYENECLTGRWSVRQLRRQIGSLLYERTGLSKDKAAVVRRARRQEPQETVEDLLRDPYVLEFTGLAERPEYRESDLETALLDHLQHFLLELGTGFCFEARQRRITVGGKHDHIDLVFYQRRLRCHVLLDLKVRPFSHGDAGQMNFYLNWWKEHAMEAGDHPPVGIVLCSDREKAEVEYATAGLDNQLFVSRYLVALPGLDQLRRFLEADRDRIESALPVPDDVGPDLVSVPSAPSAPSRRPAARKLRPAAKRSR